MSEDDPSSFGPRVDAFRRIGVRPEVQRFANYPSWAVRTLAHVVIGAAGALLLPRTPSLGLLISLLALVSLVLESRTRAIGLSRLLSRRDAQNVFATLPASGPTPLRVVVCAYADTQRKAPIPSIARVSLIPIAATMLFQILAAVAIMRGYGIALATYATVIPLVVYVPVAIVLADWAAAKPLAVGTGTSDGLTATFKIAEQFLANPIPGIELTVLLLGGEESGQPGAAAWADAQRSPFSFLNLSEVGRGSPSYLTIETPMVGSPFPYPVDWQAMAAEVAKGLPQSPVPKTLTGPTVGYAFLLRRYSGLTIGGDRSAGAEFGWRLLEAIPRAGLY